MSQSLQIETGDRVSPTDEILVRAIRLTDAEEVTALINLPGYRAGTLRPPYQSVEEVRKRLETPAPPGGLRLVVTLSGRICANRH